MAYYLVVEGDALSHCSAWCKSHIPSLALSLTSQRISTILGSITTDQKQTFLNRWMRKLMEDDYLCYDITSVFFTLKLTNISSAAIIATMRLYPS